MDVKFLCTPKSCDWEGMCLGWKTAIWQSNGRFCIVFVDTKRLSQTVYEKFALQIWGFSLIPYSGKGQRATRGVYDITSAGSWIRISCRVSIELDDVSSTVLSKTGCRGPAMASKSTATHNLCADSDRLSRTDG